ncbi:hypothetical protein HHK36_002013 [Tetracentron sinense]|uniref:Uncharacterized protein n=1 Tax=Tetracentron sinense TaxID=13715 RepID=A0A834ZYB0_TETSI|nr:hypothetical protein HHK36_002013 [Tetracentron sinense]
MILISERVDRDTQLLNMDGRRFNNAIFASQKAESVMQVVTNLSNDVASNYSPDGLRFQLTIQNYQPVLYFHSADKHCTFRGGSSGGNAQASSCCTPKMDDVHIIHPPRV